MFGQDMFGPDAQRRGHLIRNETTAIAEFVSELVRLAQERGTMTTITNQEIVLGKIGCQFGGGNGRIMTIYFQLGNFSVMMPTAAERLQDFTYDADVEGAGTVSDPFVIKWDGMLPAELAKHVLEDFIDFAIAQGTD